MSDLWWIREEAGCSRDCSWAAERDLSSMTWLLEHKPAGEGSNPERIIRISELVVFHGGPWETLVKRFQADHRLWSEGLMPDEWDEEQERARLVPV